MAIDSLWWSTFRFEYVSPVMWTQLTSGAVATFDFSLANRGRTEERFGIIVTEFEFEPQQPSVLDPGAVVYPGRAFLVNWSEEVLGGSDSDTSYDQGWWARIYTTSRDVVPSIHFYGSDGSPEFYFSPGDFAVFDLPGGFVPPVIGPTERSIVSRQT